MGNRLTVDNVLGTWHRPRLALLGSDGFRMEFPSATGRLIYAPDGFMIAIVVLERAATTESGHELMGALTSYTGRFTIHSDDWIEHHVDVARPVEWIGTTLRRRAVLTADTLDLDTPAFSTRAGTRYVRAHWERAHTDGPATSELSL